MALVTSRLWPERRSLWRDWPERDLIWRDRFERDWDDWPVILELYFLALNRMYR